MPRQTYQASIPQVAARRNPLGPDIHAMLESCSTGVSATVARAHSTVALTALPEHGNQR
jgi:hypothetical protein